MFVLQVEEFVQSQDCKQLHLHSHLGVCVPFVTVSLRLRSRHKLRFLHAVQDPRQQVLLSGLYLPGPASASCHTRTDWTEPDPQETSGGWMKIQPGTIMGDRSSGQGHRGGTWGPGLRWVCKPGGVGVLGLSCVQVPKCRGQSIRGPSRVLGVTDLMCRSIL